MLKKTSCAFGKRIKFARKSKCRKSKRMSRKRHKAKRMSRRRFRMPFRAALNGNAAAYQAGNQVPGFGTGGGKRSPATGGGAKDFVPPVAMTLELDEQIQDTASKQAEALKAALRKNNSNIQKLEDCIKKLMAMLEASKKAHGTAATKYQEVKAEIEKLEQQLTAKDTQDQEKLTAARARVAELEAEMKALGDKHAAELKALKAAHKAELDPLRAELTALEAQAGDITKLTAEHTAEIKKLNDEHEKAMAALKVKHAAAIQKLTVQTEKCEEEKELLKEELAALKQEGESKETEVASDKARIKAYEEMIESLISSLNQDRDEPCKDSQKLLRSFNETLQKNPSLFSRLTGS